jgi:hypothetical protein
MKGGKMEMGKKYKKKIVVGLVLVCVFGLGTIAGAASDWFTNGVNKANSEIGSAGYNKKEEIKANAEADIAAKVDAEISKTIDAKELELQQLLEEYYQIRINGLTDSTRYKELETKIEAIKKSVYERYRNEIDLLFDGQ